MSVVFEGILLLASRAADARRLAETAELGAIATAALTRDHAVIYRDEARLRFADEMEALARELSAGAECECVRAAIQQGLIAAGAQDVWPRLWQVMTGA